jgi:hypothetical protein
MKAMATGMGMSMAQLAVVVSSGTLDAVPAMKRMLAVMAVDNDAAASDMMKTWVGLLARMKTEGQLAAKFIAESGMASASKQAVRDITTALGSTEARAFFKEFGAGMGDIILAASAFAKVLVSWGEEIVLVGKAFLAYKVVTSFILPAMVGLNATRIRGIALIQTEVVASRAAAIGTSRQAVELAAVNRRMLAERLSAHTAELNSNRAKNAIILAEHTALAARMAATRGGIPMPGVAGFVPRPVVAGQMRAMATESASLTRQQRLLAVEIGRTQLAMQAQAAAATAAAAALARLTNASIATRIATVATNAAVAAGNALYALIGGPVGIALIALGSLAYAYYYLAGGADRAAEAERRRARAEIEGATQKGDPKKAEKALRDATKELDRLEKEKARIARLPTNRAAFGTSKEEKDKMEGDIAAAKDRIFKAEKEINGHAINIARDLEIEKQNILKTALGRRAQTIRDAGNIETAELNQRRDRELGLLINDKGPAVEKKRQEISDKYRDMGAENFKANRIKMAKMYEDEARDLEQSVLMARSGTAAQKEAQLRAVAELRTISQQIMNEMGNFGSAMPTFKLPKVKPEGGDANSKKDSPIQRLIEDLDEKKVRLLADIDSINGLKGPVDKASGVLSEMMKRWENGDFDVFGTGDNKGKVTRPDRSVAVAVAQAAAENVNLDVLLKNRTKAANDASEIADYILAKRDDLAEAAAILLNPLAISSKGNMERLDDAVMAANIDKVRAYAERMKITVDEAAKLIRSPSLVVDSANMIRTLEEETKSMNDALVQDSREASKKRTEADNERHRSAMQNIINERAARGLDPAVVTQMQNALDSSTAARAATVTDKFATPMQKMAEEWENTTAQMEQATANWGNAAMQTMTDLVTTGKADFKGLAASIIKNLIQIQLQKAMTGAVSAATGFISTAASAMFKFADGGVMNELGSMPLKKYAAGGVARSPQLAMFGEGSMAEAYVPLPDGRTIPVTMKGGGGGDVAINIVVNNSGDQSNSSTSSTGSPDEMYKRMSERIKGVVREEMLQQQRPGGSLY